METTEHRYLVFSSDIHTYHVAYIQEGITRYFSQGDHTVSLFPLGIEHFEALFGTEHHQIGVIGITDCEKSKSYFRRRHIPYLDLAENAQTPEIGFSVYYRGEGNKAAQFFVDELGLENLAYWGQTKIVSHVRRCREYSEEAESKGLEVWSLIQKRVPMQRFYERQTRLERKQMAELADLLTSLPKPAGIFCANDQLALIVKVMADKLGISIPRQLSILGVGSLHRASGGWQESVSVVQLDHQKLGYESARLMEDFMTTGVIPESVLLRPDNIIHRHTTLRRSLNDSLVRKALDIIQKDPSTSIDQLCQAVGVPRRTLEAHFHSAGKFSIGKSIDEERFQRAKYLLKNFHYNIETVAGLAGFHDSRGMRRSFFRHLKISPMNYRRSLKESSL